MNYTKNKLIKYSKAFKKKETKGLNTSKYIRREEALATIGSKDDGCVVSITI
jgi:hypothetical protein